MAEPDLDYDRATAKDVIYPGNVRVSAQEHASHQLQDVHPQGGSPVSEDVIATLDPASLIGSVHERVPPPEKPKSKK